MISLRYTIVKGTEKWVVIKQVWTALGGVDRRVGAWRNRMVPTGR